MTTTADRDGRRLYHATTSARADVPMAQGLDATGSFWGTGTMSYCHLGTVDDEIEENGEGEVHRRWAACPGTCDDSLEIVGSVLYRGPVAAPLLRRED